MGTPCHHRMVAASHRRHPADELRRPALKVSHQLTRLRTMMGQNSRRRCVTEAGAEQLHNDKATSVYIYIYIALYSSFCPCECMFVK